MAAVSLYNNVVNNQSLATFYKNKFYIKILTVAKNNHKFFLSYCIYSAVRVMCFN